VRQAEIQDEVDRLYEMAGVSRVDISKKKIGRSEVDRPSSVRQVTKETYRCMFRQVTKETYRCMFREVTKETYRCVFKESYRCMFLTKETYPCMMHKTKKEHTSIVLCIAPSNAMQRENVGCQKMKKIRFYLNNNLMT
jgi:hypothetical protein